MRGLLVCSLALGLVLLQACGGDSDSDQASLSPTAGPDSSPMTSDEVIAFVQQYKVAYQVERPDGLYAIDVVPLASRVDKFCADTPRWTAEESEGGTWRVFAQCQKEESVPAQNPLIFELLFYPAVDLVAPWNYPAHVAHSDYPWP